MPTAVVLCLLFLTSSCIAQEHDEPRFPTKEEIQLVVTQAERAFDQFKSSVATEAELPTSNKDGSGVKKDQELIAMSVKVIDVLKAKPEAFNGLFGLFLLTTLDDASRNAALCVTSGIGDLAEMLSKQDVASGYRIAGITQKCTDVSAHLYTVSESVNELLVRNMQAQQSLNEKVVDGLTKCTAALDSVRKKNPAN